MVGLSNLNLVDHLCLYMNGGPKTVTATHTPPTPSYLVLVS